MIVPHYTLDNLENLTQDSAYYQTNGGYVNIRDRAIKQAAEALGMQAGLAHESKVIDRILMSHAQNLNQIYRFQSIMIKNNVLPPVIEKSQNALQIGHQGQIIRLGGKTYKIIKQVRFVTAPPTWRTYLWLSFPAPRMPAKVLLPKTQKERTIWRHALSNGWQQGMAQALHIYQLNLHRLVRDYTGMVLYRKLLAEHMISPSAVTKKAKGITGNSQHMVIDDQVWHIVSQPELQLHSHIWHPAFVTEHSAPASVVVTDDGNPQTVPSSVDSIVRETGHGHSKTAQ